LGDLIGSGSSLALFRSFRSEQFLGWFCFRVILLVLLRCGFSVFILGSDKNRKSLNEYNYDWARLIVPIDIDSLSRQNLTNGSRRSMDGKFLFSILLAITICTSTVVRSSFNEVLICFRLYFRTDFYYCGIRLTNQEQRLWDSLRLFILEKWLSWSSELFS
jgi:hypothetical protein